MLWVRGPGACRVVAAGCLDLFFFLLWGPSMSQASCRSWRMLQAQMWWKVTVLDIALGIVLRRTGLSIVLQFLTPNVFDWFHSKRALHQWPWGTNQFVFLLGGIGNRLLTFYTCFLTAGTSSSISNSSDSYTQAGCKAFAHQNRKIISRERTQWNLLLGIDAAKLPFYICL